MRLLVITAHWPYPPRTGGAVLASEQLHLMSRAHDIYLLCPGFDKIRAADSQGSNVRTLLIKGQSPGKLVGFISRILNSLWAIVPTVAEFGTRATRERVRELLDNGNFDAVLLYEMSAIQFCPTAYRRKAVVHLEDPQSLKLKRMRALPIWSPWQKLKLFIREQVMQTYERKVLPRMGRAALLSAADLNDIARTQLYTNLVLVPYGVKRRSPDAILPKESRTRGMIVFSGSMYHEPNVDGILFFLREIYPRVLQEYPLARLSIVGAKPDRRICEFAASFQQSVAVTGEVPDLSDYVRQAMVSICPVRLKIGVQTKILEALSWGTPVVATSAANHGVAGIPGEHLWVEDEPAKFAKRLSALLRGEDWMRLSRAGLKLVTECFSWEKSIVQLENCLQETGSK